MLMLRRTLLMQQGVLVEGGLHSNGRRAFCTFVWQTGSYMRWLPVSHLVLLAECPIDPCPQPVTQLFPEVIAYVRMQMSGAASKLKAELRARFPIDDVLESWALVYPHFWDEETP